jgi:hypothetical protein
MVVLYRVDNSDSNLLISFFVFAINCNRGTDLENTLLDIYPNHNRIFFSEYCYLFQYTREICFVSLLLTPLESYLLDKLCKEIRKMIYYFCGKDFYVIFLSIFFGIMQNFLIKNKHTTILFFPFLRELRQN